MGNSKQTAISEKGNRRTGCADVAGHRQRGSMLVLGISTLLFTILLLGFVVNYGHWQYKKTMVADAAEALAKPILKNQMIYREMQKTDPDYPDTEALVDQIIGEEIQPPFGATAEFNFWRGEEEEEPEFVGEDPDPSVESERFNIARVEVCTPLDDISGLFTLADNEICMTAEALIPEERCVCDGPLSSLVDTEVIEPLKNFLDGLVDALTCNALIKTGCKKTGTFLNEILDQGTALVCDVEHTADETVRFVSTLLNAVEEGDVDSVDTTPLLEAVDCLLEETVVTVDKALVGVLGPDVIRVTYTPPER
jgi:hypothetical protein